MTGIEPTFSAWEALPRSEPTAEDDQRQDVTLSEAGERPGVRVSAPG